MESLLSCVYFLVRRLAAVFNGHMPACRQTGNTPFPDSYRDIAVCMQFFAYGYFMCMFFMFLLVACYTPYNHPCL